MSAFRQENSPQAAGTSSTGAMGRGMRDFDPALAAEIVHLAADEARLGAVSSAGRMCAYCSEPIRLVGSSFTVDRSTGEVLSAIESPDLPLGVLLTSCGTRRATRCPACAAVYQGDARVLVAAGLLGGKNVDEEVGSHPLVFATLTAPSFGPVHRESPPGTPCHGGRGARCPHGRPLTCKACHEPDDDLIGEALCPECYRYEEAVLWNASTSELWHRSVIATRRELAHVVGVSVRKFEATARLSYVKVVEYQRRGVVHVHAILRLDGADGGAPQSALDASALAVAVRTAACRVSAPYPAGRGRARWGVQLDTQVLSVADVAELRKVGNYLAKYATKSSADNGSLDRRLHSLGDLDERDVPPQMCAMVEAAWRLGDDPAYEGLDLHRWAHTLGVRAHFLTKSRTYSTTFSALRAARRDYRRDEQLARLDNDVAESEVAHIGEWAYAGRGWGSRAERFLVTQKGRQHAESRRLAAEAALLGDEPQ